MLNNVIKILVTNASRRPGETAIVCGNQQMTYAQLYEHSIKVADYLIQQNLNQKQPVGLLLQNGPHYLLSYYGCLIAGGLPVLLPTYLSSNKLTYNINKLKIDTIIFDSEFQKTVEDIELKKGTPLKKIIKQDFFGHQRQTQNIAIESLPVYEELDQPAVISFTDGNSGFPKIVVHSQQSLLSNALNCAKLIQGFRSVSMLSALPIFEFIGHSFIPHTIGLAGGRVIFYEYFNIENICKAITQNKVNILIGTPKFFDQIISVLVPESDHSIKYCIVAGGMLSANTFNILKHKFKVYISEIYGTTETQMLVVSHDCLNRDEQNLGYPFKGINIRVVQSTGARAAIGETGELQVQTPALMLNYFDDLSKNIIGVDRWFGTGDLVHFAPDYSLIYEGRMADLIYKYGEFINPAIIEKEVCRHPDVADAVAIQAEHDEKIKLYVILKESSALSDNELMNYCQQNLPGYLWPEMIEIVTHFERDLSGKIFRNLLNKS